MFFLVYFQALTSPKSECVTFALLLKLSSTKHKSLSC
jgi:hypothetical protein